MQPSLDYFLLIGELGSLGRGQSLWSPGYAASNPAKPQEQQRQQRERPPPQASWGFPIDALSRVPRLPNINYVQLAKIVPFLQQETNIVNGYGQRTAPYPKPGIKTKTYSYDTSVCFLQNPKLQTCHYTQHLLPPQGGLEPMRT